MAELIVIDGPAGVGCSTVAELVAGKLDGEMIDTGALYRALTYIMMRWVRVDVLSEKRVEPLITEMLRELPNIKLDGERVFWLSKSIGAEVRSDNVTTNVSMISSIPEVRQAVLVRTRQEVERVVRPMAITEGRAEYWEHQGLWQLAVFLDADPRIRARRRGDQDGYNMDSYVAQTRVIKELTERDCLNANREISPMRPAAPVNQLRVNLREDDKLDLIAWRLARSHKRRESQLYIDTTEASAETVAELIARTYCFLYNNQKGG